MSTATPYLRLRASLLETLGLTAAAERFAPAGALVLVYHGLVARQTDPVLERYAIEEAEFVRHLRHFKKRFAPVSIEHLADALLSRAPVDPRWVVITFDDALRTQAQRGAEILADHGIPWSLAVPSGLVGTSRSIWSYELDFLLLRCWDRPELVLPYDGFVRVPMKTRTQRERAAVRVREHLASRPTAEDLYAGLDALIALYGRDRFESRLNEYGHFQMADWGDLRRLASAGVVLVSHGFRHLPLHGQSSAAALSEEVEEGRRAMERNLGKMPRGFASAHGILGAGALAAVAQAGYTYSLTSVPGRVSNRTSAMDIPRVSGAFPLAMLRWFAARVGGKN